MSFDKYKERVEEGDTVVLYLGRNSALSFQIDVTKTHQTKYGAFPHKDLIGKVFGTKAYSMKGKGFAYLLHPTPELWTVMLPHRTQILYSTDISQITMELDLKPGSIVVESGTGSGSLSHSIVRTIKPNGHLHTFDFHEKRVESAREEFEHHGISQYITSKCADACVDGFGLEDCADAVFLDLPKPWDAIPHAKKALKKSGGRICSFSPCIEQVQRSCIVLRRLGFCEVKTVECLVRAMNVRTTPMPEANTGAGFKWEKVEKTTSVTSEDEPQSKMRKVSDGESGSDRITTNDSAKENSKSENDQQMDETNHKNEIESKSNENVNANTNSNKESSENSKNSPVNQQSSKVPSKNVTGLLPNGMVAKLTAGTKPGNINVLTSKPGKQMPGHTGYLTFASWYPSCNSEVKREE
ncbi:tRNA (adenine(58)-N(1))-methyltransferase catalytic subunit TRMT61A-like [Clytia hemisphaerica]|uniref:tRNA (adenine(58)-N(1))-methyltransferase catalytic subunit TRMT61A-like n=1 Tax=Clytia hemisphaerica TaxID=252671 RepID=UPI0034D715CC